MNSEDYCLIATFSHNSTTSVFTSDCPFNVEECKIKSKGEHDSAGVKRHRRTETAYKVTVDGHKVSYVGRSELHGPEFSGASSGSEWLVAIRNKRTQELTLKPAHFVNFRPDIKQDDDNFDESVKIDKETAIELRNQLTLQYGSKKRRRALEAKLNNSVSDKSLKDTVNLAVSQVQQENSFNDGDEADLVTSTPVAARSNPRSSILPAVNFNATSPAEIFDLNDIVSPDDFPLLTSEAEQFGKLSPSQRIQTNFNSYTCELATNLPPKAEPRRMKCIYLIYLDYLIKLCQISSDRSSFKLSHFRDYTTNTELVTRLLTKFAQKYTSNTKKGYYHKVLPAGTDKLLSHVIVLTLHLSNFSFVLSKISALMPALVESKLVSICNILGCKVKKVSSTTDRLVTLTKPPSEVTRSRWTRK